MFKLRCLFNRLIAHGCASSNDQSVHCCPLHPLAQIYRKIRLDPAVVNLLSHLPVFRAPIELHVEVPDEMGQKELDVVEAESENACQVCRTI
jgi:hypothetical protein